MDNRAYFLHSGLSLARSAVGAEGAGEWLPTPPPPGAAYPADPMVLFVIRDDASLGRLAAAQLDDAHGSK